MPRVLAVILCGLLFRVYPEILRIMLDHAEKTARHGLLYTMLAGTTIVFAGLVGLYMFLGYRSGPSGFEDALRKFSKVFRNDKEQNDKRKDGVEKSKVE